MIVIIFLKKGEDNMGNKFIMKPKVDFCFKELMADQECHRHSCCEACVSFADIIHMHASAIRRRLYLSRGPAPTTETDFLLNT